MYLVGGRRTTWGIGLDVCRKGADLDTLLFIQDLGVLLKLEEKTRQRRLPVEPNSLSSYLQEIIPRLQMATDRKNGTILISIQIALDWQTGQPPPNHLERMYEKNTPDGSVFSLTSTNDETRFTSTRKRVILQGAESRKEHLSKKHMERLYELAEQHKSP